MFLRDSHAVRPGLFPHMQGFQPQASHVFSLPNSCDQAFSSLDFRLSSLNGWGGNSAILSVDFQKLTLGHFALAT